MDAEAFLAAQLWLRPLPDEAWPPALPATTHGEQGGRNPNPKPAAAAAGAAAGAGAGARADESCDRRICGVVILAKARCCFLLENRPSGPAAGVSRGNSGGSSGGGDRVGGGRGTDNVYTSGTRGDGLRSRRRPRPLLFSTRSSSAAAGVVAAANETPACYNSSGKDNHRGTGDNRSTQASGGNPQEVERGQGTLKGRSSCDGFQRSDGGTVRVAGGSDRHQERRPPTAMATATAMPPATHDAAAPVQLKREFDFGLAIAREPPPPLGRTGSNAAGGVVRESGRTETSGTRAEEGRGTCHPRTEDQGGGGGGGGFLLLRIEGKVYEAEHTLIRSIAYPRGGGGGGGGRQEESRRNTSPSTGAAAATATDTPAVVVAAASRRGLEGGGVEGARGPSAPGGVATTAPPLLPAREPPTLTAASSPSSVADAATTAVPVAVPGAMPVPGAGQKKRRTNGASNGDDGAAGANDVGFGGVGDHGGVTEITHEERPEGVGKRSRVDNQVHATGAVGGGGCGGLTVAAAAAAAEKKEAQERSHEGDDGVEAGMPFCGLFFPGVMIKFWLPRRDTNSTAAAGAESDTRADDVARMQGVVNDMMAGLPATPRFHRPLGLGGVVVTPQQQQVDDDVARSVVSEGQCTGFRERCEAWDEFAYGSHVLFRQEESGQRDRRRWQRQRQRRRPRVHHPPQDRGGGGDAGGPLLLPSLARCSEGVVGDIGAPALLSGLSSAEDEDDARFGSAGLSELGQARALTTLAECFSAARLPARAKQAAQRRLEDAAICAGRELEDALDRAFPLDLSQGTDAQTRVSIASELEASLRRVQAARRSLLTLTLLPSSEMLDES